MKATLRKIYSCFLVWSVTAFNLNAVDWEGRGLKTIETKTEGEKNLLLLQDKEDRFFEILHTESIPKEQFDRILELREYIYRLKLISISSLRFVPDSQTIQAIVTPKSLTCSSKDYSSHVPAHILLLYNNDNSLEYNFRIVANKVFVRIKGFIENDEIEKNDLCAQLELAIKNPGLYLRKRDPEYLLGILSQLEQKVKTLQRALLAVENSNFFGTPERVNEKLILAVISHLKEYPNAGIDKIMEALEKKEIEASKKEVKAILLVFYNKLY